MCWEIIPSVVRATPKNWILSYNSNDRNGNPGRFSKYPTRSRFQQSLFTVIPPGFFLGQPAEFKERVVNRIMRQQYPMHLPLTLDAWSATIIRFWFPLFRETSFQTYRPVLLLEHGHVFSLTVAFLKHNCMKDEIKVLPVLCEIFFLLSFLSMEILKRVIARFKTWTDI